MIIALVAAMSFLVSCEDDAVVDQGPQTIAEIAVADAQFSTLVAALTKADLVSVLQGADTYTVFAPTNKAFNILLNDLGVSSLDELSKEALTPILLNHVIAGEFKSTDLSTGYISTASNSGPNSNNLNVFIKVEGGVVVNRNVSVTSTDIIASNGVIHVVNKVILPTDVVDIASNDDSFSSLVGALGAADGDLVNVLKGDGPFTVFAPVNGAFEEISAVVNGLSSAELSDVLQYHVVAGANVLSSDLTDGMVVNTLTGSFTVNIAGSTVTLTDESGATVNVIATDVQGTNGVVHVIDKVLLK